MNVATQRPVSSRVHVTSFKVLCVNVHVTVIKSSCPCPCHDFQNSACAGRKMTYRQCTEIQFAIRSVEKLRRKLILKIEMLIADWRRLESFAPIGRAKENLASIWIFVISKVKKSSWKKIGMEVISFLLQYDNFFPAETISKIMIFSGYTPDCAGVIKTNGLEFIPSRIRCCVLKQTVQYEMVWPVVRSVLVGSENRAIPRSTACPISIEWGLIVLCHNFVFEKSFLPERNCHTVWPKINITWIVTESIFWWRISRVENLVHHRPRVPYTLAR